MEGVYQVLRHLSIDDYNTQNGRMEGGKLQSMMSYRKQNYNSNN